MTQEEKAKAYDKALEIMKQVRKDLTKDSWVQPKILEAFPEIAESADEKIRKRLIEEMRRFQEEAAKESCDADFEFAKKAIAWLEKQEEKPLKVVGKGDIVAFYEEWKGEKRRGLMLVKSYDCGASGPRCIWGRCCTGTWYGDWAPSTHEFFNATEEEKQLLIDKMPDDVRARAIKLNLIPSSGR